MSHTPGPWRVRRNGLSTFIEGPDGAIARMLGSSLVDADEFVIASAPVLLRVLERAYGYVHQAPLEGALDMAAEMRAAIAKARGEQVTS